MPPSYFHRPVRPRQPLEETIFYTRYPWLHEYFLAKKACVRDYQETWQAYRYMLKGKLVAVLMLAPSCDPVINLKNDPAYNLLLRQDYPDVYPAYHMNKRHWNSLRLKGQTPDAVVREMVDDSYHLVLLSLGRKERALL